MSGPDFAGVLREQLVAEYGDEGWSELGSIRRISAALHAEVARWLADEGAREVVARAVHAHQEYSTCWDDDSGNRVSRLGAAQRALDQHSQQFYRGLARAALAALTTTEQEGDR